jgi:hypothetical protein
MPFYSHTLVIILGKNFSETIGKSIVLKLEMLGASATYLPNANLSEFVNILTDRISLNLAKFYYKARKTCFHHVCRPYMVDIMNIFTIVIKHPQNTKNGHIYCK